MLLKNSEIQLTKEENQKKNTVISSDNRMKVFWQILLNISVLKNILGHGSSTTC
jgi:hypothetical protein